jgi:hypothetical protein
MRTMYFSVLASGLPVEAFSEGRHFLSQGGLILGAGGPWNWQAGGLPHMDCPHLEMGPTGRIAPGLT